MKNGRTFQSDDEVDNNSAGSTITAYELLLRQSRKLGSFATSVWGRLRTTLEPLVGGNLRVEREATMVDDMRQQETVSNITRLKTFVRRSHQVIVTIRGAFPFTLFPTSVIVDRTKISIVRHDFFWNSQVTSIQVEDILNVTAAVGPLIGSLNISSRVMNSVDNFVIDRLWRKDAIFLKHLIQGYVIAKHNKIDTAQLSRKDLINMLCELGTDSNP